jgi:aminoglycoside phosphotransferase
MEELDSKIIQYVIQKNKLPRPIKAERFTSGVINRVYSLGKNYVIKIEGQGEHEILKPVPGLTEKLLSKGAKVPKILDFGEAEGNRYILMERVKGTNLVYNWLSLNDQDKEKIIDQLAEQLKIWHSFKFSEYCIPIVSFKPFGNLQPAIERLMNREINLINKDSLPKDFVPYIETVKNFCQEHIKELDETGTAVLVHQDIHLENIFHEGDKLTSIIDIDWSGQAPKDYELWKIMDVVHDPKYTVEGRLESLYQGYKMTKELNWLKKYYPDLFKVPNLANRVRLYYADPLMETVVDFQNGRWSENALKKVAEKVKDFYQNEWLEEALS